MVSSGSLSYSVVCLLNSVCPCKCQFDCVWVFAVSVFVRSQIWTQVSALSVEVNLDLKRSWSTLYNLLFLPNIHFLSHCISKTHFYCFHSFFLLIFFVISQALRCTFLMIRPCHMRRRQKPPQICLRLGLKNPFVSSSVQLAV